jgi:hypothetical protein
MYRQEIPGGQNSITQALLQDPMLGNYMQRDLIDLYQVEPLEFVQKYAGDFRDLFDVHPEWKEMYVLDKERTLELIKEMLDATVH